MKVLAGHAALSERPLDTLRGNPEAVDEPCHGHACDKDANVQQVSLHENEHGEDIKEKPSERDCCPTRALVA